MIGAYLRLFLFIAGLIGAVVLFAFAFTAAAVVLFVVLVLAALFGRSPNVQWWVVRRGPPSRDRTSRDDPLTIDHDPNDLPDR